MVHCPLVVCLPPLVGHFHFLLLTECLKMQHHGTLPAISSHAIPAICMAIASGPLALQVLAMNINTTVASLMGNSQMRIMLVTNTKNTGATLKERNSMRDIRENTAIAEQQEDSYI